ncbi:hypothetical protein EVAR_41010_1 [Eumeta japonica]|uniref:Uncharacterized protein n=1 Tax=Eumeta variegata TaxID=151549 RepID=A0A4C1Z1U2_EUMVA|nr:hypothetical protein EVAR_41010_1 [Eumeta japonica]
MSSDSDTEYVVSSHKQSKHSPQESMQQATPSEKVAELKSQRKRIDIYSTAISSSDINLDEFAYLDEGMIRRSKCLHRSRRTRDLEIKEAKFGHAFESATR